MTMWEFIRELHSVCCFQSKEKRVVTATNSELKRWIQNKALEIIGEKVEWNEQLDFPLSSVVLFPKRGRITLL